MTEIKTNLCVFFAPLVSPNINSIQVFLFFADVNQHLVGLKASADSKIFSRLIKEIKQFYPSCLIALRYFNAVYLFFLFKANIHLNISNADQVNVAIGDNASVIANQGKFIFLTF